MDFNEKLQRLRLQRGLTQEELAAQLFVSRAAVSKWESGRGYPGIDSLKAISKLFAVSIDDLLSGEELVSLAEDEQKSKDAHARTVSRGLLDCAAVLLFFLPLFAQRMDGLVREVPLLVLSAAPYITIPCILSALSVFVWGVMTLAMQNSPLSQRADVSLTLSGIALLVFTVSLHPYAAVFIFILLAVKAVLLLKRP